MSLPFAPRGLVPFWGRDRLILSYVTAKAAVAGTDAAIYPGDIIAASAAGPRVQRSATNTEMNDDIIGIASSYLAAGASTYMGLHDPEGLFMIQSSIPQSTAAYAFPADIGSGVEIICADSGNSAANTTALTAGVCILAKNVTNDQVFARLVGLAPIPGNDLVSSATNYPWLLVRIVPGALFQGGTSKDDI